jgi:hypothetical protein
MEAVATHTKSLPIELYKDLMGMVDGPVLSIAGNAHAGRNHSVH